MKTFAPLLENMKIKVFFFFFFFLKPEQALISDLTELNKFIITCIACFIVTDLPVLILGNIDSALSELIVAVRYNLISMTPNPALNQIE